MKFTGKGSGYTLVEGIQTGVELRGLDLVVTGSVLLPPVLNALGRGACDGVEIGPMRTDGGVNVPVVWDLTDDEENAIGEALYQAAVGDLQAYGDDSDAYAADQKNKAAREESAS